jgi:hypothetical protein
MWNEVQSQTVRYAGVSGTVTITPGGHVLSILAHATSAGSISFWDGMGGTITVPIPAGADWFHYDPKHLNATANTKLQSITFNTTDSYLVEVAYPQGP